MALAAPKQRTIRMKAYLITTGTIFGLIVLAHIWRAFAEDSHLVADPLFVLITIAAAALAFWALRLFTLLLRS